jgi:hypothetical protein
MLGLTNLQQVTTHAGLCAVLKLQVQLAVKQQMEGSRMTTAQRSLLPCTMRPTYLPMQHVQAMSFNGIR